MNVTYERDIQHCESTPYAKEVTVKTAMDAKNSDSLTAVTFEEIGWNVVVAKDKGVKPGDRLFFIPVDSVLPFELSEKLGVTSYLSKGKVKSVKLRGNRSEGLVVDKEVVEPYLPYIMKWEDVPDDSMKGNQLASREIPHRFTTFYKMPNLLNEPDTFKEGEQVYISEKIHGTNCRFGVFPHPETDEITLYVGSRTVVQAFDSTSLYSNYINFLVKHIGLENMPQEVEFFGEIFGGKIQHLKYDRTVPDFRIFAAIDHKISQEYCSPKVVTKLGEYLKLPVVNFTEMTFTNLEDMRTEANKPSEYTQSHCREGIVIQSKENPSIMAKVIGENYLKSQRRTERH